MYSGKSIPIDKYIEFSQSNVENTSKEIDILRNFKDKTFNQTQKEYLEIEINRLENENLAHNKAVDSGNQCKRYLNGEITASKYLENRNTIINDTNRIDDEIGVIKDEAITYTNKHPELKEILEKINIDEDFKTNELGGTSGSGTVYFTK